MKKKEQGETVQSLKFLSVICLLNFILSIYLSWLYNYVAIHWIIFSLPPTLFVIGIGFIYVTHFVVPFNDNKNNLKRKDVEEALSVQSIFLIPNSMICVIITLINPNWMGICACLSGIIYYLFLLIAVIKRKLSPNITTSGLLFFAVYIIFCLGYIYIIHWYQYQPLPSADIENTDTSSDELQTYPFMQFEHDSCSPDIMQLINELKMENIALKTELQQFKHIYIDNVSDVTPSDLISKRKSNLTHTITLLNNYENIYNSWDISSVQLDDIINEKSEMNVDQFDDKWFQDFVTYKKLINQQQDFLDSSVKFGADLFEENSYLKNNISKIEKEKQRLKKELLDFNDQFDDIEEQKLKLIQVIRKYDAFKQIKTIQKVNYDSIKNELKEYEEKLSEIELLTKKFYVTEQSNLVNIQNLETYIEKQWKLFERNWAKWSCDNILLWIKYKMNWFDDESCPIGINLNDIGNELSKQEINGKFLTKIDKNDLYQLGFVNFNIRKTIYHHIVELITKYKGNQVELNELQIDDSKEAKEKSNNEIKTPSKYICPLTNKIMINPVIAFDLNTYDKDAIIKYLKKYKKSPITNHVFNHNENEEIMVFTNLKLKREIEIFIKEYPDIYQSHINFEQQYHDNNNKKDESHETAIPLKHDNN